MPIVIDKQKNYLIYPIDLLIKKIVGAFFYIGIKCLPKKISAKLEHYKDSSFVNNVFGLTLFNALGGFLLMLTNIKLANVLGASLFGLYSYYLAVGEVGANFVRYGRHKTMVRDLVQHSERSFGIVSNSFVLGLLNITIYLVVVLAFSRSLDIEINLASLLLVIAPVLVSIDFQPVYEAIRLMSWQSVYNLVQRLIFLLAVWGAIAFNIKLNLTFVGIAVAVSWLLVLVVQYWEIMIQSGISLLKEVSVLELKKLYSSNFLIALSCMIGVAFGPYIRLILKNYVDSASVGIYSAGFQIFLISQIIFHQVARVGNPMMAEVGKDGTSKSKRKKFVRLYLLVLLLATLPFYFPLIFFPDVVTDYCFSDEYNALSKLLPIFGIYLFALAIGTAYEQFLISMRRDRIYFTIYVGGAILTIVLGLILIPKYGVTGGVLTLVIPGSLTRVLYLLLGESVIAKSK